MNKIILSDNIKKFNEKNINIASELILKGNVVAFATETVYGLGADATSDTAVSKIFKIKERPDFNPLIVHVHSVEQAFNYGIKTSLAIKLADKYWPGPLTLILKRKQDCPISYLVSSGLSSLAIRVPRHKLFLSLLKKIAKPIAAPSANKSGKLSPTQAKDVQEELGKSIKMILDDGNTEGGIESTVIDARMDEPIILRPGLITKEILETDFNLKVSNYKDHLIQSPGQLIKHYAPNSKLIINSKNPKNNDAFLTFSSIKPDKYFSGPLLNLSHKGDLNEVAANLFRMLRELDRTKPKSIVVAPIPNHGIGKAINNRLFRASN